ncbi:MAG: hypothetical protein IPP82_07750 [Xanthomonadales bacterium]|nr:hypothetical protein [Xanthomonadales bacterium]
MLSRIALIVLSLLLSVNAVAQKIAPATLVDAQRPLFDRLLSIEVGAPLAGSSGQVVPLWASPDGRLLAIVALSRGSGAPALPPSPTFGGVSDLRIVDATDLFSTGLRWRVGHGFRADLALGQQVVSPLSYGFANQASCVSSPCFGDKSQSGATAALTTSLGLGWASLSGLGPDLSFGLSWLSADNQQLPLLSSSVAGSSPIDLAVIDVPGLIDYHLQSSRRLSARGVWPLGQEKMIDLSAALGHATLSPIWYGLDDSRLAIDQASLGLGLVNGSLRGSIVGRINSIDAPAQMGNRRWSAIDLGVSWRTPWRGEVTVGAQNVWSNTLDSTAPRESDPGQARMPYVQYRQDL